MKKREQARTPEQQLAAARLPEKDAPYALPDGWNWVRLGGVSCNHGQKKPEQEFTYIDIGSIDNAHQRLGSLENRLMPQDAPSRARKIVNQGDILYSTVRPYLHNMCMVTQKIEPEPIASTGFAVLSPTKEVDGAFLFHYLQTQMFDDYANNPLNSRGINYPAIQEKVLLQAPIPLPPLAEQKRIAQRIESLFSKLDAAEAKLDAVEASFDPRFEAALRSAFRGELTAAWREAQPQPPIPMELSPGASLPQEEAPYPLPDGWQWARLGKAYDINPGAQSDDETMASFITMADIDPGFRSHYRATERPWGEIKRGHTQFYTNDVAFAKISPCFENRKSMIVSSLRNGIGAGTTELIILRNGFMDTRYTYYLISDELFIRRGKATYRGVVGQQRINMDFVKNYPVPIPPLYEQREIVRRLDSLLARESHAREAVRAARARLTDLRAAILGSAFRGKL